MKTTLFLSVALLSATTAMNAAPENKLPDQAKLEAMAARFVPTEITADLSKLSPNDRKVLAKLVAGFARSSTAFFSARPGPGTRRCCSISPATRAQKAGPGCIIS